MDRIKSHNKKMHLTFIPLRSIKAGDFGVKWKNYIINSVMRIMSAFETRAHNIVTALQATRHRVEAFGYSEDPVNESVSRVFRMFLTWLTACEEARLGGSFHSKVIDLLPDVDDSGWETYIMPKPESTLKQRVQAIWGVRITFTHGDGDIDLITNLRNRDYALNSIKHLPGTKIDNGKLYLSSSVSYTAIRTIVQVRDIIK